MLLTPTTEILASQSPLRVRSYPYYFELNVLSVVPTHCNRATAPSRRNRSSRRKTLAYITARSDSESALLWQQFALFWHFFGISFQSLTHVAESSLSISIYHSTIDVRRIRIVNTSVQPKIYSSATSASGIHRASPHFHPVLQ